MLYPRVNSFHCFSCPAWPGVSGGKELHRSCQGNKLQVRQLFRESMGRSTGQLNLEDSRQLTYFVVMFHSRSRPVQKVMSSTTCYAVMSRTRRCSVWTNVEIADHLLCDIPNSRQAMLMGARWECRNTCTHDIAEPHLVSDATTLSNQ